MNNWSRSSIRLLDFIILLNNWCMWRANAIWTTWLAVRGNNWMPSFLPFRSNMLVSENLIQMPLAVWFRIEPCFEEICWLKPCVSRGGREFMSFSHLAFMYHWSLLIPCLVQVGHYYGVTFWFVVLYFLLWRNHRSLFLAPHCSICSFHIVIPEQSNTTW